MRQKVAIACAYLHEPRVILFDEPLTGLDPHAIRTLKASIRERAAGGASIVVSSHLLSLVEDLCTDLLILRRGHAVFCGSVHQARSQFVCSTRVFRSKTCSFAPSRGPRLKEGPSRGRCRDACSAVAALEASPGRPVAKMRRSLMTPKGAFLTLTTLGFMSLILVPRLLFPILPQEAFAPMTRLLLHPATLFALWISTLVGARLKSPLSFSMAEVEFLFPGPFTRRHLLSFKLATSAGPAGLRGDGAVRAAVCLVAGRVAGDLSGRHVHAMVHDRRCLAVAVAGRAAADHGLGRRRPGRRSRGGLGLVLGRVRRGHRSSPAALGARLELGGARHPRAVCRL